MSLVPSNYYDQLAKVESGNNPFAKAKTSSASGLYQFTKSTWEGLGYDWSKRFDTATQNKAVQALTNQNASALSRSGIPVDAGSLYGSHFLGAATASKVYGASNTADLASIVGSSVIKANPFLSGYSVGDFKDWAAKKMTGVTTSSSTGLGGLVTDIANASQSFNDISKAIASGNIGDAVKAIAGDKISGAAKTVGNVLGIGSDEKDTSDDGSGSIFGWVRELFSAATGARFAAVFIGIVLVGVAIFFLTGTDKLVVEGAKTAAKVVI